MRNALYCLFPVCLFAATAFAEAPEQRLKPISQADAVIAVYYEDWGLVSSGSPRVILAAWPDGSIVWSDDRVKGGAPYHSGRIDPKKVEALLQRFENDGLFSDKKLSQAHFGPDSAFISVLVKSGKKKLTMQSWHEVYEENGSLVDHRGVLYGTGKRRRIDVLRDVPADYMFLLLMWNETRGRIAALIPADSQITGGHPYMEAGVLSQSSASRLANHWSFVSRRSGTIHAYTSTNAA